MSSKVEICNFALLHIGGNRTINSLTEDSEEAKLCSRHYEQTVKSLLASFDWSFAKRISSLASVSMNDWKERYNYKYALPDDCKKVLRIVPDNDRNIWNDHISYHIRGQALYTDKNPCTLEYIAETLDPSLYPPLFVDALSYHLAAKLAVNLTGDQGQKQAILQLAQQALMNAKTHDASEEPSSWINELPGYVKVRM